MTKEIHEGHKKRYEFAIPYAKGKKVVGLACGFGTGSKILADVAESVVGIDFSEQELDYARINYESENLKFLKEDVTKIPISDNSFDLAVSFEIIEHLDAIQQNDFLKELRRIVRPGGIILLSTPDNYVWQRLALYWNEHIKELTKTELLELLGGFFEVKSVWGQWFLNNEKFPRRFVRGVLNTLKRVDIFGLRQKIFSKETRNWVDMLTTPVAMGHWNLTPLDKKETGAHIIVECLNNKI
ncbi:MAG: methyltransferase domain-containing protein [Minisyncoccia bacterium]